MLNIETMDELEIDDVLRIVLIEMLNEVPENRPSLRELLNALGK